MTLTKEEAAYIAGFVDGEGSISYTHCIDKHGWERHRIHLHIYNTNCSVLEWIQSRIGGSLKAVRRTKHNPKWKKAFMLSLSALSAREVLVEISPFMIVKRRHAELVRDYSETLLDASSGRKVGLSDDVLVKRKRIYVEFRLLNRRGA